MLQHAENQMSGNIRITDFRTEGHYVHLAASGAPTFNISVQFADEASEVFSAYRDRYEFGASEMKAGCGNIYDSRNCLVGRISYNGRIWDADGNAVECAESTSHAPTPQSPAGAFSRGHIGLGNG
jgi:hypothetical protein